MTRSASAILLTRRAERQVEALLRHYAKRGRPEASIRLVAAITDAQVLIARTPANGLPAPRPYPDLARPRVAWIKSGRYWIAYGVQPPMAIRAILYDQADIPRRF